MKPVKGLVYKKGNHILVEFIEPEFGISPGQACVFYDNDRMLGGGWISDTNV